MLTSKQIADVITWSRTLLVPLFIWLGIVHGPDALPIMAVLMVVNLTADSIDGPLARRSPASPQTWIGENDLAVSAHLGHGRKLNTRQLNRLQEWVEALAADRPAIVGGDFNAGESSPQMAQLRQSWLDLFRQVNPNDDGATYQLRWPWGNPIFSQRLDYLFLKEGSSAWQTTEAHVVQSREVAHSDHLAVVARLQSVASLLGSRVRVQETSQKTVH